MLITIGAYRVNFEFHEPPVHVIVSSDTQGQVFI